MGSFEPSSRRRCATSAADVRQTDVEDDELDPVALGDLERSATGRDELHEMAIPFQAGVQRAAEPLVVLDHERQVHGRHRTPPGLGIVWEPEGAAVRWRACGGSGWLRGTEPVRQPPS